MAGLPPSILDSFSLNGKDALVTGSRKGLGAAIAVALAQAGANVAYHGKHEDVDDVCGAVRSCGRDSIYISGDVADPSVCARLRRGQGGNRPAHQSAR